MTTFHRSHPALLAALVVLGPARADESFVDLLKKVPPQANAVLFLDVQAVHASRLAAREKWGQQQDTHYIGGLNNIPRSTTRLMAAAQFAPDALDSTWEVVLLQANQDVTAEQIARNRGGSLDTVGGTPVVVLPQNVCVAVLDARTVAAQRPANRQEMGRFLRSARGGARAPVSPYLEQAAALAGREAPCVMALDLADVFDSEGVRRRLVACRLVADQKADLGQVTRLITGMRGLTLLIRVDDAITGELRLDFAETPAALAGLAKPLVQRVMDGVGAHLEDLNGWQSEVRGQAIVLRGPLSTVGARLLLSLFLTPATPVQAPPPAAPPPGAPPPGATQLPKYDPKVVASLRYFHAVAKVCEDLKNQKASSFTNLAYWHKKAAKMIDDLPVLNVDEELLKYGLAVSTTLRKMATLARGVGDTNKITEMNAQETLAAVPSGYGAYGYGGGYGGYWGYGYSVPSAAIVNNYTQVYGMMAANTATEGQLRSQTWTNIDEATRVMRVKMSQKYGVEFE
jgi:hypothetical protein